MQLDVGDCVIALDLTSIYRNMAAFAMMIFAPDHKYTKKICFVAPLFHAVIYAILIGNAVLSGKHSPNKFLKMALIDQDAILVETYITVILRSHTN